MEESRACSCVPCAGGFNEHCESCVVTASGECALVEHAKEGRGVLCMELLIKRVDGTTAATKACLDEVLV